MSPPTKDSFGPLAPTSASPQHERGHTKPPVKPAPASAPAVTDDKRGAALLAALSGVFSCSKEKRRAVGRNHKKISASQNLHLVRRLAIIAAAIRYLSVSFDASIASLKVLNGVRNAPMKFEAYETSNILSHLGDATIAESPLVLQTMKNDTTPRAYTYFLEANGVVSTTNCSTPKFLTRLYNTRFLGLAIAALMRDTYTNISEFATHQVVASVVDCSFTPIATGDDTSARVFYIMRNKATLGDLLLTAIRFSMQDYKVPERKERGPLGVSAYDIVRDMRATVPNTGMAAMLGYPFESPISVLYKDIDTAADGWRRFLTLPKDPVKEPATTVFTARRTGFYISSDSEQANIKNLYWTMNEQPKLALSKWSWKGEPTVKDSWAWVHLFHLGFALDVIFNMSLLLLVVYRNLQDGKIWLGDAFVSVSSTLLIRGVLILVSWYINGFWSLMEFCLHDAHKIAGTQEIFFHPQIMRADLLTIFLACSSVLGYAFQERIDPALAIVVFEIFFDRRLAIVKAIPAAVQKMSAFAVADHMAAVLGVSETIAASSPMQQWTTHKLPPRSLSVIFSSLAAPNGGLVIIAGYIIVRKIWFHFHKQKLIKLDSKNTAAVSEDESSLLSAKRTLTLFEIATGAELQNRFGVISDYENCIFIKGMKYASADGIYSNGFVIVSGKYVVSSADLLSIMAIKALRLPLRVYAYELKGNTVQQTARLVARDTFTWRELTHVNVTVLS